MEIATEKGIGRRPMPVATIPGQPPRFAAITAGN
jgi:hypothetical protein